MVQKIDRACRSLFPVLTCKASMWQNWVRSAGQSMSGASPWLQWRVGKWVANHRSPTDPDGYTTACQRCYSLWHVFTHRLALCRSRVYDPYNDGPATPLFHFVKW